MKFLTRLISLLCLSLLIFTSSYSENLYDRYQKALNLYKNHEYGKAKVIIEKVLNEFSRYSNAKVLYYKILYEMKDEQSEKNLKEIVEQEKDEFRIELLNFLIEKKEINRCEYVFNNIENKKYYEKMYLDFLFSNKKFGKILNLNSENAEEYIEKIEKLKNDANTEYYKGLALIKSNKVELAISSIKRAVEIYPENQVYYIKLGEIYADNKNFFLAEYNFKEALKFGENKKVYEKLFSVYLEMKDYEKLYDSAKPIMELSYVKETLRRISEDLKISKKIVVLKREGNKLYIEKSYFKNNKIGDTFLLGKEKESIRNEETGEVFDALNENYAEIRLYDNLEKVAVCLILNEYKTVKESEGYLLY